MGLDPRLTVIEERFSRVRRVIAVASSKGGVGKTLISATLALAAADKGLRPGLLDIDLTNPTAHIVLGVDTEAVKPEEEKGVVPPEVHGVRFMTVAFYSGENPLPLRGSEIDEAFKEILAITRWGELDVLFIDTPPGISNEILDLLSYIPRVETLVVTTPSPLAIRSTIRLVKMLRDADEDVVGAVVNMVDRGVADAKRLLRELGMEILGEIPMDPEVDGVLGDPNRLLRTRFGKAVANVLTRFAFTSSETLRRR